MLWYDGAITVVIPCCFVLFTLLYLSFNAVNRHITIDSLRKEVEIEWIQWGLISIEKRSKPFASFSEVHYHTYLHSLHDNPLESHVALYLVHQVADLWPCGDTGLDANEPRYDRDMAITVARMLSLPLLESTDLPWAIQPKFQEHGSASANPSIAQEAI